MPYYEFKCDDCGKVFGDFFRMPVGNTKIVATCKCGKAMRRLYTGVNINLKGAGKSPQAILGRQKKVDVETTFDKHLGAVDLPPEQWKWKRSA